LEKLGRFYLEHYHLQIKAQPGADPEIPDTRRNPNPGVKTGVKNF